MYLPVQRLRQLREWNWLVFDRSENTVDGEKGRTRRESAAESCGAEETEEPRVGYVRSEQLDKVL